jgi:hypothetical protein
MRHVWYWLISRLKPETPFSMQETNICVLNGVLEAFNHRLGRAKHHRLGFALMVVLIAAACNQTSPVHPPVTPPGTPPGSPPPPAPTGQCAITVESDVTIPTRATNTASACDYLFKGSIDIKSTLTIDPGVVMKFDKDASIWVDGGEIIAVGQPNARIVMQGFSPIQGYWRGITLGSQAGKVQLEYVDLMDAGQTCTISFCPQAALRGYGGGQLTLKNSSISNSYVNGAVLGDELVAFANNRFDNNRWHGLVIDADKVPLLDTTSDYAGTNQPNGDPYIALGTGSKVARPATWKKLNAPYKISGYISLEDTLTLEPGITMLFGSRGEGGGATLSIDPGGSLIAVGTATNPITFTRLPETQYWGGITFDPYNTTANTRFEHVQMSYGGDNDLVARAFINVYSAKVYVSNTGFQNSAGRAINCVQQNTPLLTLGPGVTFSGNASGDVDTDCQ